MRRPVPLAVLAAALAVAVIPFRGALAGRVFYQRDVHLVWYPQVEGFVRAVAQGAWPLWDPVPGFGQPLLADPGAMIAYPPTWLNLVMPPWLYYTLFVLAHLAGTVLGMYLLGRRWRMSPVGAMLAAGVWGLSGPVLSFANLWHHYASAAWIPWVFLAAHRALIARSGRAVLAWCAAMAAQVLAGSGDMVLMTSVAVGLYAARFVRWRQPLSRRNRRVVARGALALAGAAALSAITWAPALEAASRSARRALPEGVRTYWSVHPLGLLQTLLPDLWRGMALDRALHAALFESREPFLASLYLGASTPGLVVAALVVGRRPRRRYLALLGAGAALVALGRHAPFYFAAVMALPPLRMLRYPTKAMILVAFAWALLCGMGLDAWRSGRRRRWPAVPAALWTIALSSALAGAYFRTRPEQVAALLLAPGAEPGLSTAALARTLFLAAAASSMAALLATGRLLRPELARPLAAAAAAVCALDLAHVHADLHDLAPRRLYARPPVVDLLREANARRVYAYDYAYTDASPHLGGRTVPRLAGIPDGWKVDEAVALGQQMHLMPPTAGRWGIETAFEMDLRGLSPYDLGQLAIFLRRFEGTPAHTRLLQLGATTHVVALHETGFEDLQPLATVPGLFVPPVRVFAVPDPLPRSYAVTGVVPARRVAAFAALADPAVDLRRAIVLPETAAAAPPGAAGRVEELERRADRLRLRAHMDRDGWVVLADAYDPGWKVRVDGDARDLVIANLAFRAVRVPAGTHEVEMRYRPAGALWGASSSLAAAATLAAIALGGRWRSGRRSGAAAPRPAAGGHEAA